MKNNPASRLVIFLLVSFLVLMAVGAVQPAWQGRAAAPASYSVYLPLVENLPLLNDWLQFNGDPSHSGSNSLEHILSPVSVNGLQQLFQVSLPAVADGAPVYLSNVTTASGQHNLLFVTTRTGGLEALDASTGAQIWWKPSTALACKINNGSSDCYTTSSPAIDPNRQYVYSYGLDGYVHKYAVGDGTQVLTGGWPELTSRKVYDEKGSPALSLATAKNGTSYLYMANGGYPGDAGNYQGHITTINLSDGSQKVFNALCSNLTVHFVDSRATSGTDCFPQTQTAIWARPGVVYNPANDEIYMSTGNGDFTPGQFDWGETVFALHPDGSGAGNGNPLDSYTPTNFLSLSNSDTDLGSTAPALLPVNPGKYPHLAVQGGKDSVLRLLNLDNLSRQGQVGKTGGEVFTISNPVGGEILTQPAVWYNPADGGVWVFVANDSGLAALQFVLDGSGNPSLVSRWTAGAGTSPIVANGVLYYARSGLVSALNPATGSVLWSSNQVGSIHWQSPVVINGILYLEDQAGHLTAFSLP